MLKFQQNIINLILSIKSNDLNLTKKYVQELNNDPAWEETNIANHNDLIHTLNVSLSLGVLSKQVNGNESALYTIDNLRHIYNADEIKWDLIVQKVLVGSKDYIHNFILKSIKDDTIVLNQHKLSSLLNMAILSNNTNAITAIQESLSKFDKEVL